MAALWESIASQLASVGLTKLAGEAVSHGAEADARRREGLRRRAEVASSRVRGHSRSRLWPMSSRRRATCPAPKSGCRRCAA